MLTPVARGSGSEQDLRMTSEDAIRNLMFRYCELMDAGDIDTVADMFSDATIIGDDGTKLAEGRDEVRAMYARGNRRERTSGGRRSKHLTTNVYVEVDEDANTGIARSYWILLVSTSSDDPVRPILAGSYHDKFARVDGTWRFAERTFVVDLVGSEAATLLTT
jgi:3-phenylpropionate/cinnamic acid dioxygenase small subunit